MLENRSNISVVICAYTESRWNELIDAVHSMQRQSYPADEIILVIDHNPTLFERARRHFSDVTVIENTGPRGLSGARNSGIQASQGDFIAFLDDDAIASPRWLALMHTRCQDRQVLGAGGIIHPLWPGKRPEWFPEEFSWVIGCSYQDFQGKATRVRNIYGASMYIRREVFETIGGFRTTLGRTDAKSLPLGCEETELCIRAGQRWPNRFFLCDPGAVFQHHISPRRVKRSYFCSRCFAEGISKATMARYVNTKIALATEQAYTRQVLSRGLLRELHAGLRGDLSGLDRACMIVAGFAAAAAGYALGTLSNALSSRVLHNLDLPSLASAFRRNSTHFPARPVPLTPEPQRNR